MMVMVCVHTWAKRLGDGMFEGLWCSDLPGVQVPTDPHLWMFAATCTRGHPHRQTPSQGEDCVSWSKVVWLLQPQLSCSHLSLCTVRIKVPSKQVYKTRSLHVYFVPPYLEHTTQLVPQSSYRDHALHGSDWTIFKCAGMQTVCTFAVIQLLTIHDPWEGATDFRFEALGEGRRCCC